MTKLEKRLQQQLKALLALTCTARHRRTLSVLWSDDALKMLRHCRETLEEYEKQDRQSEDITTLKDRSETDKSLASLRPAPLRDSVLWLDRLRERPTLEAKFAAALMGQLTANEREINKFRANSAQSFGSKLAGGSRL